MTDNQHRVKFEAIEAACGIQMSAAQKEFHAAMLEATREIPTDETSNDSERIPHLEIIYLCIDDLLGMSPDEAREALKQPYDVLLVSVTNREWFGYGGATRFLDHLHKTDPKNAQKEDVNDSEDEIPKLEDVSEPKSK